MQFNTKVDKFRDDNNAETEEEKTREEIENDTDTEIQMQDKMNKIK